MGFDSFDLLCSALLLLLLSLLASGIASWEVTVSGATETVSLDASTQIASTLLSEPPPSEVYSPRKQAPYSPGYT